jgi:asparagine synthase (glutamine-hydrolysing)
VSKFCGIFHFDARPPSAEDEARVRTALDSPGRFTPQSCWQPGLFMGWVAGSDAPQRQGMFQAADRSVCLWDGRIDNRQDLLGLTGVRPDCGDAELILSTYGKTGIDGLRHIIGDWSLCIWNADRREMVLASDYAGIRPLYYHRSTHSLYWSSSLSDLVRWTGVTELDDTFAAGFLSRGNAAGRTPYAGILPVPAGQAVSIDRNRIQNRAFWTLPIDREVRYPDERQYGERLLEIFRESVQARLARDAPTCAELSGGLDSSSVVCMANRLRRELSGEVPDLITFSYTHEKSSDEKFFLEVERSCQVTGCHLDLNEYPAAEADRMGVVPGLWEPRFQGLARKMAALGSSVLLTGQLGDFVMGNTHDDIGQVAEWLGKGRIGEAVRTAYAWARAMQVPIYPILWRNFREAYFHWVPSTSMNASVGAMPASTEDSLSDDCRARFKSYRRERLADDPTREAPPGRRRRLRTAAEALQSRALQTPDALQHLSYAHPYAHRPLVEFMLTIPAEIVVGPNQPRRLMRRAFAGLLPSVVLNRKSKASYETAFRGSLLPLATALLKNPHDIQLVERGYVDRRSLTSRLERFSQGLDCNETQLRQMLLFEFWLRKRMPSAQSLTRSPELAAS